MGARRPRVAMSQEDLELKVRVDSRVIGQRNFADKVQEEILLLT